MSERVRSRSRGHPGRRGSARIGQTTEDVTNPRTIGGNFKLKQISPDLAAANQSPSLHQAKSLHATRIGLKSLAQELRGTTSVLAVDGLEHSASDGRVGNRKEISTIPLEQEE